jgi:hypothetical protein
MIGGYIAQSTKLLLALASTAILGSESHRSHDHILLSDGSRLTDCLLYDTDRIENDASNNSSVGAGIRCRGKVFTGPLPSNDRRDTHTYRLMGGIYAIRRCDGLRCAMTYIPNFIKIGSGIQKLKGGIQRERGFPKQGK